MRLLGRALAIVIVDHPAGTVALGPSWLEPRLVFAANLHGLGNLSDRVLGCDDRSRDRCVPFALAMEYPGIAVLVTTGWLWLVPGDTDGRFWRLPPRPLERVAPGASIGNDGGVAASDVPPASTELPERSEEAPISREPITASTLPMDETVVEL